MQFDTREESLDEFELKYFVRILYLDAPQTEGKFTERMVGLFDSIEEMALWCKDFHSKNPHRGFVLEAIRIIKKEN